MKLLREFYELCDGGICHDLLTEEEKLRIKNGGYILSGVMQRAEVVNGNGRVYPQKILQREIKNYQKMVAERRALGELDHPDDSVINLKNASHLVTDIWMENNSVMGKIEVLSTPSGKILRDLIDAGVKLGISSRGLGSVKKKGEKTFVEEDFQLICFDMVSEPSTPGAYMMTESKKAPNIFTRADKINRALNNILEEEE